MCLTDRYKTIYVCASGSVGGARPCQGRGRGFESRLALFARYNTILYMREWLSWWSTTLPRSGSRVRVPSRALLIYKRYPKRIPFVYKRVLPDSNVRGLRSAPVGAEPTSTGCRAPSRAMKDSAGLERFESSFHFGRCRIVFFSFIRDEGVAGAFFSVTSQHTGHWPGLF